MADIQVAVKTQSVLGEGAIWDNQRQCLFWVDIFQGLLHKYDPVTMAHQTKEIGGFLGSVVPSDTHLLMLLVNRDFVTYDWDTHALTTLARVDEHLTGNRFNDGKCDPQGRFWAGTMAISETEATGSLYCLENDQSVTKKLDQLSISNGIVWSSDQKTMYYIDTPTMEVWAFDFDRETGNIHNKRIAVTIENKEGFPDGMAIDHEDKLWIAHYGGSQVARWDPQTGKKIFSVSVPASQVTSCAFGGKNLDQIYITCARKGLSVSQLEKEPFAGALFVYDTAGTFKGVPANRFKFNT